MNGRRSKRNIGSIGEEIAEQFLVNNGYLILEKNFYYQHGEVDIIAKDGETLVFVEVKTRRSTRFGAPEEAVTVKKQEILRRTAEGYVMLKNLNNVECRFDVVSISMNNGKAECILLKDCF
ncbi:MAG: YraN family protein [Bacteroidota bacterium]